MEAEAHHGLLSTGRQHLHGHPEHIPAGDDDWWEYFPCPFCYIEVEFSFLGDHLQEEHCFDMKNDVCPICADSIGTDKAEHFRDQHSHLLKFRKSSSSSKPIPAAAADKETYEEDSYYEEQSYCMSRPAPDSSPDPLLAWFICSVAPPVVDSEPDDTEEDGHAPPSLSPDDQRLNQVVAMDDATSKRDLEERLRRSEFVKQMVITTIGED